MTDTARLDQLTHLSSLPINFNYPKPTPTELALLKQQHRIQIIAEEKFINPVNFYYQTNFLGTHATVYTREAVWLRLKKIAALLAPNYGLYIYDAFRTITTQKMIYNDFSAHIREKHPDWSAEEVEKETRKFASHPTDRNHFKIPLHNSGGAIDLAIFDAKTKEPLVYGSEFDELTELSRTNFFEQDYDPSYRFSPHEWQTFRKHRRLLFNSMKEFGFINFHNEWWHYDLGDCYWAQQLEMDWSFDSMESLIVQNV